MVGYYFSIILLKGILLKEDVVETLCSQVTTYNHMIYLPASRKCLDNVQIMIGFV